MMETVKEKVLSIIKDNKIGTMATLNGQKPYVRYMTFTNEEFVLYTTTAQQSQKVYDLENNPYTHILLGYTREDLNAPYVEILAKLTEMTDDNPIKIKIAKFFKEIFSSEESDMVTLQLEPVTIKLMNDGDPQEIHF